MERVRQSDRHIGRGGEAKEKERMRRRRRRRWRATKVTFGLQ